MRVLHALSGEAARSTCVWVLNFAELDCLVVCRHLSQASRYSSSDCFKAQSSFHRFCLWDTPAPPLLTCS